MSTPCDSSTPTFEVPCLAVKALSKSPALPHSGDILLAPPGCLGTQARPFPCKQPSSHLLCCAKQAAPRLLPALRAGAEEFQCRFQGFRREAQGEPQCSRFLEPVELQQAAQEVFPPHFLLGWQAEPGAQAAVQALPGTRIRRQAPVPQSIPILTFSFSHL